MSKNEVFFSNLPNEIKETVRRNGPSLSFDQFIKWVNPKELSDGTQDIGRSTMFLGERSKKKEKRPETHRKKKLSCYQRKNLGLYSLSRNELTFSQVLPINKLWEEYMRKLLKTKELEISNWNNRPDHPMFEQTSFKFYRADFHGAYVTVIKSLCPSLVGHSGIVAMETKSCYKLVGKDNQCRTVPKKNCQFEIHLDGFKFQYYGHNFITRPAERSSKKIKLVRPSSLSLIT